MIDSQEIIHEIDSFSFFVKWAEKNGHFNDKNYRMTKAFEEFLSVHMSFDNYPKMIIKEGDKVISLLHSNFLIQISDDKNIKLIQPDKDTVFIAHQVMIGKNNKIHFIFKNEKKYEDECFCFFYSSYDNIDDFLYRWKLPDADVGSVVIDLILTD